MTSSFYPPHGSHSKRIPQSYSQSISQSFIKPFPTQGEAQRGGDHQTGNWIAHGHFVYSCGFIIHEPTRRTKPPPILNWFTSFMGQLSTNLAKRKYSLNTRWWASCTEFKTVIKWDFRCDKNLINFELLKLIQAENSQELSRDIGYGRQSLFIS